MKLLIFLSHLFCRHKYVYNKKEYRIYKTLFRSTMVKRYRVVQATRCIKCDKLIKDEVIDNELTKTRLHTHYKLSYGEIDNITETTK